METGITETKNEVQSLLKQEVSKNNYETLVRFNNYINSEPKKEWVKVNKYSDNAKYLPIRVVESLLRSFFGVYQTEMIGQPHIIGNSVVVSVQLKVYHPILKEWITNAGVGAVPIELKATKKDKAGNVIEEGAAHALDFEKLNSKALHKNIPAAKAFAVSNAAKSLGRIFGSDLNNDEISTIYNVYGF